VTGAVDDPRALPTAADVEGAAARIAGLVHRTPVLTCQALDLWSGAQVFLKAEHLQKVGAFKARGATNAVWSLTDAEAGDGVAAHSSGNHAAALAWAAGTRGVPCRVVMPSDAPAVKLAAARDYGAEVVLCDPTVAARESTLTELRRRTGATEVHPYDDPRVIAGAGTAALELLEQVGDLDAVVVPIGGGGLFSGTAIWLRAVAPRVEVWAAEPSGADDAARSLEAGELVPQLQPDTMADGLRTSLSPRTFRALSELGDGVVTVDDALTLGAMELLWTRAKQVVEPSGAVALAAMANGRFAGRRVGVVLSGGNVEPERALGWMLAEAPSPGRGGLGTTPPRPTDWGP
jgi:threonine dehydratase